MYKHQGITWIDLESPTRDEVLHIIYEYNLSANLTDELNNPTLRSKVDTYDNIAYIVLHFPRFSKKPKTLGGDLEVDFVIGEKFLITTHYDSSDRLRRFITQFETKTGFGDKIGSDHAAHLFATIIEHMYRGTINELEGINGTLQEIEQNIFDHNDQGRMVATISHTNRKLLDVKRALRFHDDILRSLEAVSRGIFPPHATHRIGILLGEYNKVNLVVDGFRDILRDLRDTNDSLLSYKTNETMKTLTAITVIMLPLTLVAGIFGMNMPWPLIGSTDDLWIVVGAMALSGIIIYTYFKLKRWL